MSAAGLREKHIRAMTALEDVVQQNQEMKKQLAILTAAAAAAETRTGASSESDQHLAQLRNDIALLKQDKEDLQVRLDEAVAQCKKLSNDLNAEMKASDRERKYVRRVSNSFTTTTITTMIRIVGVPLYFEVVAKNVGVYDDAPLAACMVV